MLCSIRLLVSFLFSPSFRFPLCSSPLPLATYRLFACHISSKNGCNSSLLLPYTITSTTHTNLIASVAIFRYVPISNGPDEFLSVNVHDESDVFAYQVRRGCPQAQRSYSSSRSQRKCDNPNALHWRINRLQVEQVRSSWDRSTSLLWVRQPAQWMYTREGRQILWRSSRWTWFERTWAQRNTSPQY